MHQRRGFRNRLRVDIGTFVTTNLWPCQNIGTVALNGCIMTAESLATSENSRFVGNNRSFGYVRAQISIGSDGAEKGFSIRQPSVRAA
jgi:hypothetical protein